MEFVTTKFEFSLNGIDFPAQVSSHRFTFYPNPSLLRISSPISASAPAIGNKTLIIDGKGFFDNSAATERYIQSKGSDVHLIYCLFVQTNTFPNIPAGDINRFRTKGFLLSGTNLNGERSLTCQTPPLNPTFIWELFVTFDSAGDNYDTIPYNYHGVDTTGNNNNGISTNGLLFFPEPCEQGTYSIHYTIACTDCAVGFSGPTRGLTACTTCDPGYFSDKEGLINCEACRDSNAYTTQESFDFSTIGENTDKPSAPRLISGSISSSNCTCRPGFAFDYVLYNQKRCTRDESCCFPCPVGAVCPGSNDIRTGNAVEPYAHSGYFRLRDDSRGYPEDEFIKCEPPEACKGGPDVDDQCNARYQGLLCGNCRYAFVFCMRLQNLFHNSFMFLIFTYPTITTDVVTIRAINIARLVQT